MYPAMADSAKPKKVSLTEVKVEGKVKPNTFKLPEGYTSESDGEVKEAVLKFKELPDGTCQMLSLDGAPFGKGEAKDHDEDTEKVGMTDTVQGEEPMDDDMPLEDAITKLQQRDQMKG